MSREMVWGLFNWSTSSWITEHGKRIRFSDAERAGCFAESKHWGRHVGPRPFYVTRRVKPLPPAVAAVLDEVRLILQGRPGDPVLRGLEAAVQRWDEEREDLRSTRRDV